MLDWVTATSAADAWAVAGEAMTSLTAGTPLILHWDGNGWAKVPLPAVAWTGLLTLVAASSPSDAWAVGRDTTGLSHVLHWNGRAWQGTGSPVTPTRRLTSAPSPPARPGRRGWPEPASARTAARR